MPRKKTEAKTKRVGGVGPREERYLSCTRCGAQHYLNLGVYEDRPMHRCSALRSTAPFNVDVLRSQAPKPTAWYEQKAEAMLKNQASPAQGTGPQIVL